MSSYASLCSHTNLARLNQDFVKCKGCGETFIDQNIPSRNQTAAKYADDNKIFDQTFNRNFDNKFMTKKEWNNIYQDYQAEAKAQSPLEYLTGYVTYISKDGKTEILVDNEPAHIMPSHHTGEYQYKVRINGKWNTLTNAEIKRLLGKLEAVIY